MSYLEHLKLNWQVAFKSRTVTMFLFHFIHGLIPCELTSHEYWGIYGKRN